MASSRNFIKPSTEAILISAGAQFAEKRLRSLPAGETSTLATTAPQALLQPISYQIVNLAPFDIPVYVFVIRRHHVLIALQCHRHGFCRPHLHSHIIFLHRDDRSLSKRSIWLGQTSEDSVTHQNEVDKCLLHVLRDLPVLFTPECRLSS